MSRQINCYDVILLAKILKSSVDMTYMAIQYQHPIYTLLTGSDMLLELPKLFQTWCSAYQLARWNRPETTKAAPQIYHQQHNKLLSPIPDCLAE
jgi:hypothetical protein